MIDFTDENVRIKIHDIYKDQAGTTQIELKELFTLCSFFNTYYVNVPVISRYLPYWQFLHECLKGFETGTWVSLPIVDIPMLCNPRLTLLTDLQVKREYDVYLQARSKILKQRGISSSNVMDKEVLFLWITSNINNNTIRNKNGYDDLLSIAHTLLRMYLYYTRLSLKGISNSASFENPEDDTPYTSFNNADLSKEPVKGGTKMEITNSLLNPQNNSDYK